MCLCFIDGETEVVEKVHIAKASLNIKARWDFSSMSASPPLHRQGPTVVKQRARFPGNPSSRTHKPGKLGHVLSGLISPGWKLVIA